MKHKYEQAIIDKLVAYVNEGTLRTEQTPAEEAIYTNDLKQGDLVLIPNPLGGDGYWVAELWDNMRGNTRLCYVYGDFPEAGSVYSHDMCYVRRDGVWMSLTWTQQQLKLRDMVKGDI